MGVLTAGLVLLAAAAAVDPATASSAASFWSQRSDIVRQLSSTAGSADDAERRADWDRDYLWDSTASVLYRRTPQGLRRCLEQEAELHNLVKELACGAALLRAPAIAAALQPLYWPVYLPAVRSLFARGGICRSAALRTAYKDYTRRHNAAVADPRSPHSKFLVYQICCGQLGNRIQSLVASFLMALLSGRTFLVSWPVSPGLSNETVSDLFEIPKGLVAWEAEQVFAKLTKEEVEASKLQLPLHHAQLSQGWGELLCSNLTEAYTTKFLIVESNQYFAPALALNAHYTEAVREMFTRSPAVGMTTPSARSAVAALLDSHKAGGGGGGGGSQEEEEEEEVVVVVAADDRSDGQAPTAARAGKTKKDKKKQQQQQKKKRSQEAHKSRGGAGAAAEALPAREQRRAPLPLPTLDIFGALSPLILRPTAVLRKKLRQFGHEHLGVGEDTMANGSGGGSGTGEEGAEGGGGGGGRRSGKGSGGPAVPPYTVGIQLRTKDRHPMSDRQIDAFLSCAKAAAMSSTVVSAAGQLQLPGDADDSDRGETEGHENDDAQSSPPPPPPPPPPPVIFLATDRPSLREELKKRHGLDGAKRSRLFEPFDSYLKVLCLPRQARDKHRER